MNLITPQEFEIAYRRAEQNLYGRLAQSTSWFGYFFAVFAVVTIILVAGANLTLHQHDFHPELFNIRLMFGAQTGVMLAVGLSLGSLVIAQRYLIPFFFACTTAVWITNVNHTYQGSSEPFTQFCLDLFLPCLLLASYFCANKARTSGNRKAWAIGLFSLYVLSIAFVCLIVFNSSPNQRFNFWTHKHQLLGLAFLVLLTQAQFKRENALILFNPANAMRGILWPYDSRHSELDRGKKMHSWWWGLTNITLGYLLIIVSSNLLHLEHKPESLTLLQSLKAFLMGRLDDVGAFNILAGMGRLYGFSLRDPTNFVFLARRPDDIWKRTSVYNYLFSLQYIFVPVYRNFRSRILATALGFSFFAFNHFGIEGLFSGFFMGSGLTPINYKRIIFVIAWIFAIFVTKRWWIFDNERSENGWTAWASILATQATALIIVIFCDRASRLFGSAN